MSADPVLTIDAVGTELTAQVVPIAAARPATHFLLLQGLPGPFFRRLGRMLRGSGRRVSRINFNGGDVLDWRQRGATAYRGDGAGWATWLADHLHAHDVSDIVLFGDCRPLHREAIRVAGAMGRRVHVFEEGYLRPNHVTLERGGVNGFSTFPDTIEDVRRLAEGPAGSDIAVRGTFLRRVRDSVVYYLGVALLMPVFPRYRSHRARPFLAEAIGWLRRFRRRGREVAASNAGLARLAGRPYFLLPLQLDGDSQLLFHAPFTSMTEALALILDSFAANAPDAVHLVVKMHPLDPDLAKWRERVTRMGDASGVGYRITFIERGDLDRLVAAATGIVTVNSTVGPLALAAGTPVLALGKAIYRVAGLTAEMPLDAFWGAPGTVDAELLDAFRSALKASALVNGGFHSDAALDLLVANAATRLLRT